MKGSAKNWVLPNFWRNEMYFAILGVPISTSTRAKLKTLTGIGIQEIRVALTLNKHILSGGF
uniref:Uncharacterized protein n=1 Tax=Tolypothrix bouteillei VB521301 TaxID=1479485 RepID=A0A0C1R867_9CYAN